MSNINVPLGQDTKQVTISDTAVLLTALPVTPFTAAQVLAASRAVITVRTNAINIRYDGTAPTTAVGHLRSSGESFAILGNENISLLQLIRNGTDDSVVTITLES